MTALPSSARQRVVSRWPAGTTAERIAYGVGALLICSGITHLVILVASATSWSGPLSWRKPMAFGMSFGLSVVSIAWVSKFLDLRDRTRSALIYAFTLASTWETALVTLQTWRGVPSHFNIETPFDALVAQSLAVGGLVLVVVIASLTVAAFRTRATASPSLLLAIRAGFTALLGAQLVGAAMIARGMRLVVTGQAQVAYATGGWLKPTHGVLMHAVLVLPGLAWFLWYLDWPERYRRTVVVMAISAYIVVVGSVALTNLHDVTR